MLEGRKVKTSQAKRQRPKASQSQDRQASATQDSKDDLGTQLGVVDGGLMGCKAALSSLRDSLQGHNHNDEKVTSASNSGGPGDSTRDSGQVEDVHTSRATLLSDAGSETSPSRGDYTRANKEEDDVLVPLQSIRGEVQLLASSLVTFGRQLQALQQKQLQHVTSSREDTANMLNKFEALQNLCRDTAAMGMQHAEAVLGIGLRMEVLEKQVAPLLEDKNGEPSKEQAASVEPSASGHSDARANGAYTPSKPTDLPLNSQNSAAALNQQFSETALKVYGQVSSIECRMDKLEERISAEVQRAVNNLGFSFLGKDDVVQAALANSFDIASTCSSHGEAWTTVQADLVKQVEGLLNHVTQVEGLLQPAQLPAGPRRMSSASSAYRERPGYPPVATIRTARTDSRAPSPAVSAVSRQGSLPPGSLQHTGCSLQTGPLTPIAPISAGGSVTFPLGPVGSLELGSPQPSPKVNPPQVRGRQVEPSPQASLVIHSSPVRKPPWSPQIDAREPRSPNAALRSAVLGPEQPPTSPPFSGFRTSLMQRQRVSIGGAPTAAHDGKVEKLIQHWSNPAVCSRHSTPLRLAPGVTQV